MSAYVYFLEVALEMLLELRKIKERKKMLT